MHSKHYGSNELLVLDIQRSTSTFILRVPNFTIILAIYMNYYLGGKPDDRSDRRSSDSTPWSESLASDNLVKATGSSAC